MSKSLNVALRQLARAAACRWIAWLPFLYTVAKFLLELSLPMWVLGNAAGTWQWGDMGSAGQLISASHFVSPAATKFVCGDLNSLHSFLTKASR